MEKDVLILAIESSCDETAAAVVKMDLSLKHAQHAMDKAM